MAALSISRAWDETKAVLRRDGRLIVPIALAFLLLPGVVSELAMPSTDPASSTATKQLVMLVVLLLGFAGQLAVQWLSINSGETVGGALRRAVGRVPALLLAGLLIIIPLSILIAPVAAPILANPENPPPGAVLGMMAIMLAVLLPLSRFSLAAPVTVAEKAGPIAMLRRSWGLTSGSTLKLYGLLLLVLILALILIAAVQMAVGSLAILAFGQPEPWSLSALLIALATQGVAAIVSVTLSIIFARLYVQAAGEQAPASVPDAP